ncbi:MAG: hypothetical protein WCC26_01250 [Terracidiphilus sp.]
MRREFLMILLAGATALSAQTQGARLGGTWRLNVAKSFLGGDHPFSDYALTKTIVQTGDAVSITDASVHNSVVNIPLPDSTTTLEVAVDGKEHLQTQQAGFPGMPVSKAAVTAEWQGGTLEMVQVVSGFANYSKQRLFLSEDGSQLIDLVEQHSIYGDGEQRLVFEKAP